VGALVHCWVVISFLRPVLETWLEAARAARNNPLRTALAALATAAAVATIIVVVSGLDGVARYARETGERAFGSDTFVVAQVVPGQLSRRELADRLARNPPIRAADVRFLDRVAGDAVIYAPTAQRAADIAAGSRVFENAAISGTSDTLPDIRVIDIEAGRFFTHTEATGAAQVVVIGADIADTLFPFENALGNRVRIAGRGFEVIGVVLRQGTAGGVTLDRYAYMPLAAFERAFGPLPSLQVFARAPHGGEPALAEGRAHASLRARRQLAPGAADTFDILTPEAARTFVLQLANRIGAAALPISLMALLAAIVVVANTVLVSVTERMRELGIRRAMGATRARITGEVLAESLITACLGGAAGMAVSLSLLAVAGAVLDLALPARASTLLGAGAAAIGTGLLAGYVPARRAARIDVVAALRAE
jgi:putative ABC transport system permease protein